MTIYLDPTTGLVPVRGLLFYVLHSSPSNVGSVALIPSGYFPPGAILHRVVSCRVPEGTVPGLAFMDTVGVTVPPSG